ncbi:hypothetical protein PLICRDRAFT_395718 [Plicaturopsis crispa FD-325 SS-3]|nr:hypothetical protein PLICRDRAFT_395718 [Plicaturopsis crispa FD-325 SS-3]
MRRILVLKSSRHMNRLSGLLENRGVTEDHKDTERIFRDAEIQILRAKHDEILQVLTSTETNVERTRMLEAESFEKDKKIEALEAECAAFKEDIRHLELRNLDLELQVKVASDNESDLRRIQSNQESALQNMERIVQAERRRLRVTSNPQLSRNWKAWFLN